jgi:hypothetical protein
VVRQHFHCKSDLDPSSADFATLSSISAENDTCFMMCGGFAFFQQYRPPNESSSIASSGDVRQRTTISKALPMTDYEAIAAAFDELAVAHETIARALEKIVDPQNTRINRDLADAERLHADSCRQVADALRSRKQAAQ